MRREWVLKIREKCREERFMRKLEEINKESEG